MFLVNQLRRIANRLGLVRIIEIKAEATPAKVATRSVTLDELMAQTRDDELKALAELPAELSVAFERIFDSAGIKAPAGGWSIQKLRELLAAEPYREMDRKAAQAALLPLLQKAGASAEAIVKDAVARDAALDAYEGFVRQKVATRTELRQGKLARIQEQADDLARQRRQIEEELKADQRHLDEWFDRKLAYEKELAQAVGYLLDRPVISIEEKRK